MNEILDFSVRANPLGMPESIRNTLSGALARGLGEPVDRSCRELRERIAQRHGAGAAQIALSDCEDELILLLALTSRARRALLLWPCPESYEKALAEAKIGVKKLKLPSSRHFHLAEGELREALQSCDLLLMGNPAFPAPALVPPNALLAELDQWIADGGWLILDESAIDFTYGSVTNSLWSAVRREPRVAILRSFTNYFALNMLPFCYAVSNSTSWITEVRQRQREPALCGLTQSLGSALENLMPFRTQTTDFITNLMPKFIARLRRISGLKTFPTDANWVLCRLERGDITAAEFAQKLRERGIVIKTCVDGSYFTLSLKKAADTDRFIKSAREILMPKDSDKRLPPR
jgi:threonine-phosphate decarboxylase